MSQKLLIALVVLVVVIGGGYYLYQSSAPASYTPPTPTPSVTPPPPASSAAPPASGAATHAVSIDANGFTPSSLTIKMRDTVTFKNNDTRTHWPASGVHPTHQLCPGFDALRPLQPGETYSYTFTVAKECPFHDHLLPSLRGKITVTDMDKG